MHKLDAKGAASRILDPEVTTAGDMGRMVVTVLGMVAAMELKIHPRPPTCGNRRGEGQGHLQGAPEEGG